MKLEAVLKCGGRHRRHKQLLGTERNKRKAAAEKMPDLSPVPPEPSPATLP